MGVFSRIAADKYVRDEATLIDVMNAVDEDKFCGFATEGASKEIDEARTRLYVRSTASSLGAGCLVALMTCVSSVVFWRILTFAGRYILPLFIPAGIWFGYIPHNQYWPSVALLVIILLAQRQKIAIIFILLGIITSSFIILDKSHFYILHKHPFVCEGEWKSKDGRYYIKFIIDKNNKASMDSKNILPHKKANLILDKNIISINHNNRVYSTLERKKGYIIYKTDKETILLYKVDRK